MKILEIDLEKSKKEFMSREDLVSVATSITDNVQNQLDEIAEKYMEEPDIRALIKNQIKSLESKI